AVASVARSRAQACGACGPAPGDLLFAQALILLIADRCSRPPAAAPLIGSSLRALACGACGAAPGDLLFAQALIAGGWLGWGVQTPRRRTGSSTSGVARRVRGVAAARVSSPAARRRARGVVESDV